MVNFNPAPFPGLVPSAAAQMCVCAGGQGDGRALSPLCQHRLRLPKALVSPQLEELRPALRQPVSVQPQPRESLAAAVQGAREGLTARLPSLSSGDQTSSSQLARLTPSHLGPLWQF